MQVSETLHQSHAYTRWRLMFFIRHCVLEIFTILPEDKITFPSISGFFGLISKAPLGMHLGRVDKIDRQGRTGKRRETMNNASYEIIEECYPSFFSTWK